MINVTLKPLISDISFNYGWNDSTTKTPLEKLEKALSAMYDTFSSKPLCICKLSTYLNFGKQTLKSLTFLFLIFFTGSTIAQEYSDDEDSLPYVEIKSPRNLQQLGLQAIEEEKIILLEMSASYCGYCKMLEENIIKPMLRSGDYEDYVLIRKLDIDSYYGITDFDGNKTSPEQYAYKVNVSLTPTLLFMDGHGKEISERIPGVNTLELYGQYVDEALLQGHRKIKQ
jgi:thioredoxin-related protein